MVELKSLCTGTGGESLCSDYNTDEYDTNGDGEFDLTCGYYFHYYGYNKDEFHCVAR